MRKVSKSEDQQLGIRTNLSCQLESLMRARKACVALYTPADGAAKLSQGFLLTGDKDATT